MSHLPKSMFQRLNQKQVQPRVERVPFTSSTPSEDGTSTPDIAGWRLEPQQPSFQFSCGVGGSILREARPEQRPVFLTSSWLTEQGCQPERKGPQSRHPALEQQLRNFPRGRGRPPQQTGLKLSPGESTFLEQNFGKFQPNGILKISGDLVASNWELVVPCEQQAKCSQLIYQIKLVRKTRIPSGSRTSLKDCSQKL